MSKTLSTSSHPLSVSTSGTKPRLWEVQEHFPSTTNEASLISTIPTPLCSKDETSRQGVCCKDIKLTDERSLINSDIIRDVIIGLSDGLTVPFALTAGLSGIGSSHFVVLAGVAELISGSISMGVGGYFSAKAERDHYLFQLRFFQEKVDKSCHKNLVDEMKQVLEPYGASVEDASLLTKSLFQAEQNKREVSSLSRTRFLFSRTYRRDQQSFSTNHTQDHRGLTSFLVEMGRGLEPVTTSRAYISAITIGFSYVIGGLVPLLPYIIIKDVQKALYVSIAMTSTMLLIFGLVKQKYSGAAVGFNGYAFGAISTLAIGGIAAGASYGIVKGIEGRETIKM